MRINLPTTGPDVPELPVHPTLRHPLTGEPLRALGFTRSGKTIWPVVGGSQPIGEPSQPTNPPAPPVPTPPPAPAPPPAQPAPPGAPATTPTAQTPPATVPTGEHGYPENTPLAAMTPEQREAYWRHHARKHEDRVRAMADYDELKAKAAELEQLKAANATDHEKAIATARAEARAQALREASSTLVDAYVRAAIADRLAPDQVNVLVSGLSPAQFLAQDGVSVDPAKVSAWVSAFIPAANTALPAAPTPAGPQAPATSGTPAGTVIPAGTTAGAASESSSGPDFGQGTPTAPRSGGLEAGRHIAMARFGIKQAPAA